MVSNCKRQCLIIALILPAWPWTRSTGGEHRCILTDVQVTCTLFSWLQIHPLYVSGHNFRVIFPIHIFIRIKLPFSGYKHYLAPALKWHAWNFTLGNTWTFYHPRKNTSKEQKSTKIKGTKSACSEDRPIIESKCCMGMGIQGNGKGYAEFSFVLTFLQS